MITRIFYDAAGRITSAATMPPEHEPPLPSADTAPYLVVDTMPDMQTSYVADRQVIPRPANPAVLTGTSLTNLPQPCTIAVAGQVFVCEDGHANLTLPPGEYKVVVLAWPYLEAEFNVRV